MEHAKEGPWCDFVERQYTKECSPKVGAHWPGKLTCQWPIVTSLILPAVANEFNVARPPLLTLAQNIGLLAGALFFGFGCDIFGRKVCFLYAICHAPFRTPGSRSSM